MQRLTGRSTGFVLFETTLIIAAVWVAAYIRLGHAVTSLMVSDNSPVKMLLVVGALQVAMYVSGLYGDASYSGRTTLFIRLVQALAIASLVLAVLYFFLPDLIVGRGVFAIAAVLIFMSVISWRLLFDVFGRRVTAAH
jgi:FlaA1/EpsC-like NDP-sugar epimerase